MSTDWGIHTLLRKGFIALAILVLGFGGWANFATISGAVIIPAHIDAGKNRHSLQHLRGGKVTDIRVTDGDHVVAGQLLVTLDSAHLETELAILQGQHAALLARRARLIAEQTNGTLQFPENLSTLAAQNSDLSQILKNERGLFEAQSDLLAQSLRQLDYQQRQINIQQDGILAERVAVQTRFDLVSETLKDQEDLLQKGLVAADRVSSLAQQRAALEGDLARLETAFADAGAKVAQISLNAIRLKSDRHQKVVSELSDVEVRLVGLEEQLRGLSDDIEKQTILAPINGTVHGLGFSVSGGIIRAGDVFLEVLPTDGSKRAVANLPTSYVDQVYTGQTVTLRLPDFGIRDAPEIDGIVHHISPDAFVDQNNGQRFYKVEIDIPKQSLADLGGDQGLLPGMSVEAFLHTGAKRPIAYLTDPFMDYFRKAFRES